MRLRQGRWTTENRARLEELLARKFAEPPIAIFDWDNTCILGDTADVVFHELCRDLAFHFEDEGFREWIEELPVPTRILECYEMYRARPSRDTHAGLSFEFERTRWTLHLSEDDNQAWAWDSGAFVGWKPSQVREYTRRVLARELAQPLRTEILTSSDSLAIEYSRAMEPRTAVHEAQGLTSGQEIHVANGMLVLQRARGLRVRAEMRELFSEMRRAGWQVYVITASPQWEIEAFAERYFLPQQNVFGMRRAVVNGVITIASEPPCSWGDGKLDAYQMFVTRERPPNFVAGDSVGDWTLLEWATDCALLVGCTNQGLTIFARWKQSLGENWLIQNFE